MANSTNNARESLASRTLPQMTFSDGSEASMTGPPPPMPHYLTGEGRAVKRFAIEGNAMRMSTFEKASTFLTLHLQHLEYSILKGKLQ